VELVADRFALMDDGRAIDLASGSRVLLIRSRAGDAAEQIRWLTRCGWFGALAQPAIARLIDYGRIGTTHRFEAWRCGEPWRGCSAEGERTMHQADAFFRATRVTSGRIGEDGLRTYDGRAVIVPDEPAGYESVGSGAAIAQPIDVSSFGLTMLERPAIVAVSELFDDVARVQPRVVALCGPHGSGLTVAVRQLARLARLQGFVPMAIHVLKGSIEPLVGERSLFLIDVNGLQGWSGLVRATLRAPRAHVLLFAGLEVPRVAQVRLERISVEALRAAVRPQPEGRITTRIEAAARRSRGLPARFTNLLWGWPAHVRSPGTKRSVAAEPRQSYDVTSESAEASAGDAEGWPAPGELASLRRKLALAIRQMEAGHHISGERALRQCVGGLTRRHDWVHATLGGLALAAGLLKRGRPRDACGVLAETHEHAAKAEQHDVLLDAAILTGVGLTDQARLEDAVRVLGAALASAKSADDHIRVVSSSLALARCQFWRGRFDEADALLSSLDPAQTSPPHAVRLALGISRAAVGRGDLGRAVARAAEALVSAERQNHAGLVGEAACGLAFAHLSVGDHSAVERDLSACIRAARAARDPLRALRARLLAAESARRQGRKQPATVLLRRVGKLSAVTLAPTLRARCALLADMLSSPSPDVVRRHVSESGLPALALFTSWQGAGPLSAAQSAVDDGLEILRCCQEDEDGSVLTQVCARLRAQLRAAAVGFFALDRGSTIPLAAEGGGLETAIVERAIAARQTIAPHLCRERIEGAAPVRYGGDAIGAVAARWALGMPFDPPRASLLLTIAATAAGPALAAALARRTGPPERMMGELIGTSQAMADVRRAVERAAAAPFAVLIEGESGSGKELVARGVHRGGPRRDRPFCTLNCAALPDDLVEAELFGHSRGAFTGAIAERPGVFEEAHTGTLFLDEVGELSLRAQAKVLRTIQEGELRRVGENSSRRVDVRIVSATNRDLRQQVAAGRFRLDLLYRLDVIRISLPPLRERPEDVAALAGQFWRDAAERVGSKSTLSSATLAALARYHWPGNVRELQNVLAALAVRSPKRGTIPPSALPPAFHDGDPGPAWRLDRARRTFDERFVRAALARTGGHRRRTAEELGLTRQGLSKLMNRLGIDRDA